MMNYKVATTIDEIKDYIKGYSVIAFDIECSPNEKYRNEKLAALDPHKASITGISFSVSEGSGVYVPLRHRNGENVDNINEIMSWLDVNFFKNKNIVKVAHNIAYESSFLYNVGIVLSMPFYDTMCASQLTLKSKWEFRKLYDSGLKKLVPEIFKVDMPSFEQVTQGKHFDELDSNNEETIRYACADSDYTLRLYERINKWFHMYMPRHKYICENVESPTAVYTGIMKNNGIGVDIARMLEKQKEAEEKLEHIRNTINTLAGREIKLGANASTKDFKDFLFKELKLPVLKVTDKLKESTDDEAFLMLKQWCQREKPEVVAFIEAVQEYRKWAKLKSTYIDGFLKVINSETGKIHTDFFPMGTETGRFSSKNPNLQNLPRKDSDPIGVRDFFVPSPGYVFLDFDFSQIELRVGAFYCRDKKMVETYKTNGDIHGITTSVIYGIPFEDAIDKEFPGFKERRTIAKNCNFGVFFGLFPRGLQSTLKYKAGIVKTEAECELIINNIKKGYPALVPWQEDTKRLAAIRTYSETALGRRRMLSGINSSQWSVSSYFERCALNTPIQGTAADILKLAIGRILGELENRPYIRPLLQIHDELLFEVREDKLEEAKAIIKACMEEKPFETFDVPIVAECEVGRRFGNMSEG